jgi:hypothetical protein
VIAGWTWWAAGEPGWWDDVGANDGGHYSVTPTDGNTYTGEHDHDQGLVLTSGLGDLIGAEYAG